MMKRIYVQRPTGEYKRVAVLQDGARRATPDQLREIQTRLQAKHGNARVVFVNSASWAHADTILRKNLPGAVILKDEGHRRRAPNPPTPQTEAGVLEQLRAKASDLLRAARNVPAARAHANWMDDRSTAREMWDALDSLANDPAVLRASSSNAAIARALGLATSTLERTRQFVAGQVLGRKANPHRLGLRPGDRVKLVGYSKPVGRVVSKKHPDPGFVFVEWEGDYGPTPEPKRRYQLERVENPAGARIVHNRLLGGWYVVTGPHQTPISGRFDSKAEAQEWLNRKRNPRPKTIAEGAAAVLFSAGFAGLAREVREGKEDAAASLEFALRSHPREAQVPFLKRALALVKRGTKNPTGPPPGTARVRLRHAVAAGKSVREAGINGTVMAGSILGGALKVKFDGDRAAHWVPSTAVEFLNPGKRAAGPWATNPRRRRSQPNGHVPASRRRGAGGRFVAGKRAR